MKSKTKMESKGQNIDFLFHPRSIALVGITRDAANPMAAMFLRPLIDLKFEGDIYLVNPHGGKIGGMDVYTTIKDIPGHVDYVIASVPARFSPQMVQDCVTKGVKAIHFFTAGFSESGDEKGIELEAEITQIARQGGIRIVGPNCMGIYCPQSRLSYWAEFPKESGHIGYLCQSGGNSIHLVQMGAPRGLRFSKVISYGNACDINECDLIEFFINDPDTDQIAIYIEGVRDGPRFIEVLGKAAKIKPVFLLKGGTSDAGTRAVASHTGSLSGSDATWDALCTQLGVIRTYSLEELSDMLVTFQFMSVPNGHNVVIVGIGGGASVLATDDCESNGMTVPLLPSEIMDQLTEFTPIVGNSVRNPIDSQTIIWEPNRFVDTVRIVSGWQGADIIMALLISTDVFPSWATEFDMYNSMAKTMMESSRVSLKPMAMVVQPGIRPEMTKDAFDVQQKFVAAGFPVYHSVARAANAISRYIEFHHNHT